MKINTLQVQFGRKDCGEGEDIEGVASYAHDRLSVTFNVRCAPETVIWQIARLERAIAAVFSDGEESDDKTGDDPRQATPQYLIGMLDNLTKRVEALDAGRTETARAIAEVQNNIAQCTYGISTLTKAEALLAREDKLEHIDKRIAEICDELVKMTSHTASVHGSFDAEVQERQALSTRLAAFTNECSQQIAEQGKRALDTAAQVASASVRIETKLVEQEKARADEVASLRRELRTLGDSVNASTSAQMALADRVAQLEVVANVDKPKEPQVELTNTTSAQLNRAARAHDLGARGLVEPQLPATERAHLQSVVKQAEMSRPFVNESAKPTEVSEGAIAAAKLGARPDAPPPDAVKAFGIDVDAPPFATEEPLDESEDALPGDEKKLSVVQLMHDAAAMESCIAELQAFAKDASAYFKEANNSQTLPFSRLLFAIAKYECQSTTAIDRWVSKRVEDKAELRAYIAAFVDCLLEEGNDAYVRGNVKKLAAHFVQPMIGILLAPGRIMPLDQIESALAAARGAVKSLTAAQGSA